MSRYQVEVKTGDRNYAGTDASVYIQLIGAHAKSEEKGLDNSENNFERNKLDTFFLELDNVGWINSIRVFHDNGGSCPGWYLEWVKVTDESVGVSFKADYYRWLAKDEGDQQIDVTMPVSIGSVELSHGSIVSTFMGYDVRRRMNSSPTDVTAKETFSYSFKEGLSVLTGTAKKFSTGLKLSSSFFGIGCDLTVAFEQTATRQLNTTQEQTLQSSTEIGYTLPVNQNRTIIMFYYQDVLKGQACANDVCMEFEQRYTMVGEWVILEGWLSDSEVDDAVRELEGLSIEGSGGSSEMLPNPMPKTNAQISIAQRAVAGPLNEQNATKAIQALGTFRKGPDALSGRFKVVKVKKPLGAGLPGIP